MSGELKARLRADLNDARKSREKLRTLVLSTTLSELKNREIELGGEADEQEVLGYLNVRVWLEPEAVEAVAVRADVISVDRYREPELHDERQDMIVSGNITGSGPKNYFWEQVRTRFSRFW